MNPTTTDHTRHLEQLNQLHDHLEAIALTIGLFACAVLAGVGISWWTTRRYKARWTWAAVWIVPLLEMPAGMYDGWLAGKTAVVTAATVGGLALGHLAYGARKEIADLQAGDDRAHEARERIGPMHLLDRIFWRAGGIVVGWWPELQIGLTRRGQVAAIKRGGTSGSHRLVIGATGSGKSTLLGVLALEGAARGNAVVMVEGKIDPGLEQQARRAARAVGREFVMVSPAGDWTWDMLATGDIDETVTKLLACEVWNEEYYRVQAARFVRWVVRVGRKLDGPLGLGKVLELAEPDQLAAAAATVGDPQLASEVEGFVDQLSAKERADIGGLRSRLALLAESDFGKAWLDPESASGPVLDLKEAIRDRSVMYFRLDAERLGPVAEKVGAAVAVELGAIASSLQGTPIPTTVCIDEFSAIGSEQIDRLFTRGRAAGVSVTVATQAGADLRVAGEAVEDRLKATVDTVIVFRVGPDDADSMARVAGQVGTSQRTRRTQGALGFAGQAGTETRGYRLRVHPSVLQHLEWGQCAVIRLDRNDDHRVQIANVVPAWKRERIEIWPVDEDDS